METYVREPLINGYKKEAVLGNGSFGTIYLVKLNNAPYALKEINLNTLTVVERQRAFNEVSLMAKLKHRNIVQYKDSSYHHTTGILSIVMDYADSGDLAGVIAKQNGVPFKLHKILSWFTQINLALQYIHSQNILHRDLKPQNIFLSGRNTIKVGDFGISLILKNSEEFAKSRIGTPYYLSPEVYMGKLYNRKSDMWALGCVLFEMSTLDRPFKADSLLQLSAVILDGKRQPFPSWMKYSLLKILVERLLSNNPDHRPSTDEILADPALKSYLPLNVQDSEITSTFELRPRKAYRSPPESSLKRSASALNSNASALPKSALRTAGNEKKPRSASTRTVSPTLINNECQDKFGANDQTSCCASTSSIPPVIIVTEYQDKFEANKEKLQSASVRSSTLPVITITENKTPDKFQEGNQKQRFVFSRATPPAVDEYQDKLEANREKPHSASMRTTPPAIVTGNKTPDECQENKQRYVFSRNTPPAIVTGNKTPDECQENKQKQRYVFSRNTPPAISIDKNKTPNSFTDLRQGSRSSMNTTYIVDKETKSMKNSKVTELLPSDVDCGYLSEEINCSTHSVFNSAFEHSKNEVRNEVSIQKSMNHGGKTAYNISSSNGSHCEHSQCHQCMIDMMWKNRIRGCVSVSRSNDDYLKLKNKLLLIFGSDLFQKVYKSLLHEWEGTHAQASIRSFAKLLNYEQVQHLPLMMQLIQLDLVKLSNEAISSNELIML